MLPGQLIDYNRIIFNGTTGIIEHAKTFQYQDPKQSIYQSLYNDSLVDFDQSNVMTD